MSERIIKTPHLPQGKVGLAAFGAKYREILEKTAAKPRYNRRSGCPITRPWTRASPGTPT